MSRISSAQLKEEIYLPENKNENITEEQINLSIRKLARLRANLKAVRSEISDKLLFKTNDCRKSIDTAMQTIGDINATINTKNK
jgi:hypothetical protein